MRAGRWLGVVLGSFLAAASPLHAASAPVGVGGPPLRVAPAVLAASLACPSPVRHPPVLLVHATAVTAEENWGWTYGRTLPLLGYDVCLVQLPDRALGDIQVSAEYVVHAIRTIAARSPTGHLDVVGMSAGGLVSRWALRWWPDTRTLVDHLVEIVAPNHGSLVVSGMCVPSCVPALWQMRYGSRFLSALNAGEETPAGPSYTSIFTRTDEFVQPEVPAADSAALKGASNIAVQDVCPGRFMEHTQGAYDAVVYAIVLDTLTHRGGSIASRIGRDACTQTAMPGVDPVTVSAREAGFLAHLPADLYLHDQARQEPPPAAYVQG